MNGPISVGGELKAAWHTPPPYAALSWKSDVLLLRDLSWALVWHDRRWLSSDHDENFSWGMTAGKNNYRQGLRI